jgi:hypothetical protein
MIVKTITDWKMPYTVEERKTLGLCSLRSSNDRSMGLVLCVVQARLRQA